jgi:anti-anti-sigma regulatory factor
MLSFDREGNGLRVSGSLGSAEMEEFLRRGQELLGGEAPQLLLDIRQAQPKDSSFLGVIAQLGAEARGRSKTLIVRANGRVADLLVWAGLHRIVTLYVANTSPSPARDLTPG